MSLSVSLIEIPRFDGDPDLAEQAALLILNEVGEKPHPSEMEVKLQLADMKPKVTVAAISGELVVATGTLRKPEPEIEENVGYIAELAVASKYRGEGLGRGLVGLLERKAQEAGVLKLSVYSLKSARGFYERLGYQRGSTENLGDYFKYL